MPCIFGSTKEWFFVRYIWHSALRLTFLNAKYTCIRLFKKVFGPVDKPDVGGLPEPQFFRFLVPQSPMHGDLLALDDIGQHNVLERGFAKDQQALQCAKAQIVEFGDE